MRQRIGRHDRPNRTGTKKRVPHRFAGTAEVECELKAAQYRGEPVRKVGGDAIDKKRRPAQHSRAPAAMANKRTIKNYRARR